MIMQSELSNDEINHSVANHGW